MLMQGVTPESGRTRVLENRGALLVTLWLAAALGAVLPAAAGAYATIAPPPSYSSAPGLPDNRVYEQVSPPAKNGNQALGRSYGVASADGKAVMFQSSGAIGSAVSGASAEYVSRRAKSGWSTSATVPRPVEPLLTATPKFVVPSADFTSFVFTSYQRFPYLSSVPPYSTNLYLTSDPFSAPTWLAEPAIPHPIPALGGDEQFAYNYMVAGVTPDLGTIYYTYSGTLLPQDELRAPHVDDGLGQSEADAWGFYRWSNGVLGEAGILPDGTLSPFGAVPAAIAGNYGLERSSDLEPNYRAEVVDNQVSADGSRAYFVSPDPQVSTVSNSECGTPTCTTAPPELYVRETAPDGTQSTVLVSQSQLPGHVGQPAPNGPVAVTNAAPQKGSRGNEGLGVTYMYGSPDGSHVFFQSTDPLTSLAPSDGSVKKYDFDVDTGQLTYLPGVVGPVVTSSWDGSRMLFENTATDDLDLWMNGPNGGHVSQIVQGTGSGFVGRASATGSAFVLVTSRALPGGFNNAGGYLQVYRYDVGDATLSCISCPPTGVTPSGDANLSYASSSVGLGMNSTVDTRGVSSDGGRIFFDTPESLVTQDTNGRYDVYEWENGTIFLLSGGSSEEDSRFIDSSVDGDDVFFDTAQGNVPGDVDDSQDVYDARVPHPGDNPPPEAVPCQGTVCQGPPRVPTPLAAPASSTFDGLGNVAPQTLAATVTATHKRVKSKKVSKKQKKHKKRKRKSRKTRSNSRTKGNR